MKGDMENGGKIEKKPAIERTRVGRTTEDSTEEKVIDFREAAERIREKRARREMGRKVIKEVEKEGIEEATIRGGEVRGRKELTVAERLGEMVKRAGARRGGRERRSIEALGIRQRAETSKEEVSKEEPEVEERSEEVDFDRIQKGLEERADEFRREWDEFEAVKAEIPGASEMTAEAEKPEREAVNVEKKNEEEEENWRNLKETLARIERRKDAALRRAEWARRRESEKAQEKVRAKIERNKRAKRVLKELAMDGLVAVAALGIFMGAAVKNARAETDKFAGKPAPKKVEKETKAVPSSEVEGVTESEEGGLKVNLEKVASNLKLNQEKQAQREKESAVAEAGKADIGDYENGDYAKWSGYWDQRSRDFFGDDVETGGVHIDYDNGIYEAN